MLFLQHGFVFLYATIQKTIQLSLQKIMTNHAYRYYYCITRTT